MYIFIMHLYAQAQNMLSQLTTCCHLNLCIHACLQALLLCAGIVQLCAGIVQLNAFAKLAFSKSDVHKQEANHPFYSSIQFELQDYPHVSRLSSPVSTTPTE